MFEDSAYFKEFQKKMFEKVKYCQTNKKSRKHIVNDI
jgi:hypothetical protein